MSCTIQWYLYYVRIAVSNFIIYRRHQFNIFLNWIYSLVNKNHTWVFSSGNQLHTHARTHIPPPLQWKTPSFHKYWRSLWRWKYESVGIFLFLDLLKVHMPLDLSYKHDSVFGLKINLYTLKMLRMYVRTRARKYTHTHTHCLL